MRSMRDLIHDAIYPNTRAGAGIFHIRTLVLPEI